MKDYKKKISNPFSYETWKVNWQFLSIFDCKFSGCDLSTKKRRMKLSTWNRFGRFSIGFSLKIELIFWEKFLLVLRRYVFFFGKYRIFRCICRGKYLPALFDGKLFALIWRECRLNRSWIEMDRFKLKMPTPHWIQRCWVAGIIVVGKWCRNNRRSGP